MEGLGEMGKTMLGDRGLSCGVPWYEALGEGLRRVRHAWRGLSGVAGARESGAEFILMSALGAATRVRRLGKG